MSNEKLSQMHEMVADVFLEALKEGVPVQDAQTGKVHKAPPSSAYMSVIVKFLKDNHVEALPVDGSKVKSIAASLPFAGQRSDPDEETDSYH